jgi:predicted alpha/beta-fold hydrolase
LGFSIGANLILRYAGLMNDHCSFKAIISVGNPFNLLVCSEDLLRPMKRIYKEAIVENFKWLLRHHLEEMKPNVEKHGIDIDKAMLATTP